jgi:GNAT superfamily N-acetyltransferase
VDWQDAQVQIVCACRPHLDLPPVLVREATENDRAAVQALIERDFGRTRIVAFDEVIDVAGLPALVSVMHGELSGALVYRLLNDALHVVALATDPGWQRSGVGGHLIAEAELLARRLNLPRVVVATTNDNLPALYFYQRRGYRLTALVPNSVLAHTGQVCAGFAGIPVQDEVRLEKTLPALGRHD